MRFNEGELGVEPRTVQRSADTAPPMRRLPALIEKTDDECKTTVDRLNLGSMVRVLLSPKTSEKTSRAISRAE